MKKSALVAGRFYFVITVNIHNIYILLHALYVYYNFLPANIVICMTTPVSQYREGTVSLHPLVLIAGPAQLHRFKCANAYT